MDAEEESQLLEYPKSEDPLTRALYYWAGAEIGLGPWLSGKPTWPNLQPDMLAAHLASETEPFVREEIVRYWLKKAFVLGDSGDLILDCIFASNRRDLARALYMHVWGYQPRWKKVVYLLEQLPKRLLSKLENPDFDRRQLNMIEGMFDCMQIVICHAGTVHCYDSPEANYEKEELSEAFDESDDEDCGPFVYSPDVNNMYADATEVEYNPAPALDSVNQLGIAHLSCVIYREALHQLYERATRLVLDTRYESEVLALLIPQLCDLFSKTPPNDDHCNGLEAHNSCCVLKPFDRFLRNSKADVRDRLRPSILETFRHILPGVHSKFERCIVRLCGQLGEEGVNLAANIANRSRRPNDEGQ